VEKVWVRAVQAEEMKKSEENHTQMEMGGESGEMKGTNSAAYMVIRNSGNQADKLIGVESDVAEAIEIHKSEIIDDVMKMRPVEFIEIPADGEIELKPGGFHIMLIGVTRDLMEGENVELRLLFEQSADLQIMADIRSP
jgi:copper(I)-binding protein